MKNSPKSSLKKALGCKVNENGCISPFIEIADMRLKS